MKKEEFRRWLMEIDGRNGAQTSDHISRVKRVENAITKLENVDCDVEDECNKDGGASLLEKLSLSSRRNMPADINLPLTSMGMSRLRSSLKKYIDFFKWSENYLNK